MERAYDDRYKVWRKAVLDKCNSKCVRCGSYKDPHCHHIKTWAAFPELRFDVANGEVLCEVCHMLEHPFMVDYKIKALERKQLRQQREKKQRAVNRLKRKERKLRRKQQKSLKQYRNHRFDKYHPNPNWDPIKFDEDMKQRLELDNT